MLHIKSKIRMTLFCAVKTYISGGYNICGIIYIGLYKKLALENFLMLA